MDKNKLEPTLSARQNWSTETERKLNDQINLELLASHQYLFLASYFGRDDIGLNQLVKYFNKASLEERGHAELLINYQNKRGGQVKLSTIPKPEVELKESQNVWDAFEYALLIEKIVNKQLLELHKIADNNNDPQCQDFLEGTLLNEQVDAISELSKILSQLKMIGSNKYGIWEFINKLD